MAVNMSEDHWKRQNVVKQNGQWTVDGRPSAQVEVSEHRTPPNMKGKTWLTLLVTLPPNSATPPHTHNNAAVIATVIKGRVLNQMIHPKDEEGEAGACSLNGSGPKVYEVGESWYEAPGCHHVRSGNAGKDGEEALFVANLVIDTQRLDGEGSIESKVVLIDAAEDEKVQRQHRS